MTRRAPLFAGITFVAVASAACGGDVEDAARIASDAGLANDTRSEPVRDASQPSTQIPKLDASVSTCGDYLGSPDTFEAYAAAGALGVYRVVQSLEECSGLGGRHVVFERVADCGVAVERVHYGGHGCHDASPWQVGELVVAAVEPQAVEPRNPGWCIEDLSTTSAKVRQLSRAGTTEAGVELIAKYGCIAK